ncbi:MAG: AlpA family phage regulatory protein, partial [Burkholderiales bacterium]
MERTALPAIGLSTADEKRIQRLPPYLNVLALGEQVLQLKRTATRAVISRPDFPAPIELGGRHRLWVTAEVMAWIERQPRLQARPMPASLASVRRYSDGRLVAGAHRSG